MQTDDIAGTIGERIAALQSHYYGQAPARYKAYVLDGLVAVVLEETFTPAEQALIQRGESEGIQDIRRRFQRTMADQFKEIVEQATGQTVRAFMSDTDLEARVSVEMFLLAGDREDMTAFETEIDRPESKQHRDERKGREDD